MKSKTVNFVGFQYVVERKPPDPICFGSKVPRDTNPVGKGLSPFQKKQAPEIFEQTGPGRYATEKYNGAFSKLSNKVWSKKGTGLLASADHRFKNKIYLRTPSPSRYASQASWAAKQQNKAPFLTNTERMTLRDNKIPGPGTYTGVTRKCHKTRFMYNFGKPTMVPSIEIICVSRPSDTCIKCNQICEGDYWHKDYVVYLCHLCWEEEKRVKELYDPKELKTFKKIRNCSFAHRHEGTTAAVRLLPPKKINKKLRLENYLDLYIQC